MLQSNTFRQLQRLPDNTTEMTGHDPTHPASHFPNEVASQPGSWKLNGIEM